MKRTIWILILANLLTHSFGQYKDQRMDLFKILPITNTDIVFAGNSITNGAEWQDFFPDLNIKNRGISGNTSLMLLDRISDITKGKPKKIFLLIGINDGNNPSVTQNNLAAIIDKIKLESPYTEIYVQSILPVNNTFSNFSHNKLGSIILENNNAIKNICTSKSVTYIDVYSSLITSETDHNLNTDFTNDGLHLLGNGYAKWAEILTPYLDSKSVNISKVTNYLPVANSPTYSNQRISQFEGLKGAANDVIFFGDNFINTPEWNELFRNENIKGRGIGISTGTSILLPEMLEAVKRIYKGYTDVKPSKFFIYAGANDLLAGKQLSNIQNELTSIIDFIQTQSANTQIYIQNIIPTTSATQTSSFVGLNLALKQLAESKSVNYIDLYSIFESNGTLNPIFRTSDTKYLNAKGYIRWANSVYTLIDESILPIQESEYIEPVDVPAPILSYKNLIFDGLSNSQISGSDYTKIMSLSSGTIVGSFISNSNDFKKDQLFFAFSDKNKDFRYTGLGLLYLESSSPYRASITMTDGTKELSYGILSSSNVLSNKIGVALRAKSTVQYNSFVYYNESFVPIRTNNPGTSIYQFAHNSTSFHIGGVSTFTEANKKPLYGECNFLYFFKEELTDEQIKFILESDGKLTSGLKETETSAIKIVRSNNNTTLHLPNGEIGQTAVVYDISGKLLKTYNTKDFQKIELFQNDMLNGIYIIKILTNIKTHTLKVII